MGSVLKLENVCKKYKTQTAVDNISFVLDEGEIVGLVGPNGAGKTTLMRIIVGLTRNYEGKVFINNTDIRNGNGLEKKHIGCVIESPGFYPYMSGYQNLIFFSELSGIVDKKQIADIVELLGLSKAINKKVKHYSMGMKQRLGIAQALLHNPRFLILDEPTNGLDPSGIHEIREYLQKIVHEKKITMLISSHVLSEIEKICNRVLIIQTGKLIKTIDLNETINENEESIFVFETNEVERLEEFLRNKNIRILESKEKSITIKNSKKDMPKLIQAISKSEIEFSGVQENRKTLEKQFLDIMEGNQIE